MTEIRDGLGNIRASCDLADQIQKLAEAVGFTTYFLGYTSPEVSDKQFWLHNLPKGDWAIPDAVVRDPVLQHIITTPEVICWGPDTYHRANASDIWESGAAVGLHSGIACPIRPGGKRRMVLSFDRSSALDDTSDHQNAQAKEIERFTHQLAGTVVTLFDTQQELERRLSPTEIEALKWVFHGLVPVEVAKRMNKGTSLIRKALNDATAKLEAGNSIQAAMMAARYGLLGDV